MKLNRITMAGLKKIAAFIFTRFSTSLETGDRVLRLRSGLNEILQLLHHQIHFFPCVVFTKTKTYRYLVWVVVDGTDNVAALIGTTGAGAAAAGANIIYVEIEKYHL